VESRKLKRTRLIVVAVTALLAVLIFSFTLGHTLVEGKDLSISSFALLHFSGYLFFLIMPVELAFSYCVTNGYNINLLVGIALVTAIAAQIIDYMIGYFVSSKFLQNLLNQKKHERAIGYIRKYGSLTIFVFNVLPLSSPIICLAAGVINHPFRKVVFYSIAGLLIKYYIIGWIILR
jgi:membrane protein YqaA with SNARE-associated domain